MQVAPPSFDENVQIERRGAQEAAIPLPKNRAATKSISTTVGGAKRGQRPPETQFQLKTGPGRYIYGSRSSDTWHKRVGQPDESPITTNKQRKKHPCQLVAGKGEKEARQLHVIPHDVHSPPTLRENR